MARPRPVTATVTKPDWMKLQFVRERNNSLDSIGSTASLISILDHDSCESEDDPLPEKTSPNKKQNTLYFSHELLNSRNQKENQTFSELEKEENRSQFIEAISKGFQDIHISSVAEDKFGFVLSGYQTISSSPCNEKLLCSLTPWEKWLLMKIKEEQDISLKLEEQREIEKIAKMKEAQALEEKKIQNNRSQHKWLEEKAKEERLRMHKKKREYREKKQHETAKKQEIAEKSEYNFKIWLSNKKILEKNKKKIEAQQKKEEELLHQQRQEKAKEKYKEWCETLKKSSNKAAPVSFNFTTGKLTGLSDKNVYPTSSFYNPVPWKPLVIPVKTNENDKCKL